MLSPSMYSPPRSLHRSIRIFHCWKQCSRSSSDSLFMSSAIAFFCLGELGLFQCMDWCLLSGSYWKNHDSSQVIMFSKKFWLFSVFWRMSAQMFIQISFCSGVRSLGTIFEHTFFMLKLLCKICRTVSLSMLINSANARMLRRWFHQTISPTFFMLASVFDVLGRPGCWSSPISSLPSLNLLNHLKTWVRDRHSSP